MNVAVCFSNNWDIENYFRCTPTLTLASMVNAFSPKTVTDNSNTSFKFGFTQVPKSVHPHYIPSTRIHVFGWVSAQMWSILLVSSNWRSQPFIWGYYLGFLTDFFSRSTSSSWPSFVWSWFDYLCSFFTNWLTVRLCGYGGFQYFCESPCHIARWRSWSWPVPGYGFVSPGGVWMSFRGMVCYTYWCSWPLSMVVSYSSSVG